MDRLLVVLYTNFVSLDMNYSFRLHLLSHKNVLVASWESID